MSEAKRLDGSHARQLEVLTKVAHDLAAAAALMELVLQGEGGDRLLRWTCALVSYGRCFGKGVPPWGGSEAVNRLPEMLQSRHRHFRRLREVLVSLPGGIDQGYRAEVMIEGGGHRRIQCTETQTNLLGTLDAMDFHELLVTLQSFVELRVIEVMNELQFDISELSDDELQQLPTVDPHTGLRCIATSSGSAST